MALPVQQQNGFAAPGSPAEGKRDILPRSAGADTARRRADDSRRLRMVKDSKEQLKRRTTRARGASYSTIDTTASNTSAGRSYTVANVNNGVIYLRYAHAQFGSGQTSELASWLACELACLLCAGVGGGRGRGWHRRHVGKQGRGKEPCIMGSSDRPPSARAHVHARWLY